MIVKKAESIFWPLALALLAGLLHASPCAALRVNFDSRGDVDRITFSFDSGKMQPYSVARTGERELTVGFDPGIWDVEPKPGGKDFPAKQVESITTRGDDVIIRTRSNAFGYFRSDVPGRPQLLLQVYRDPIGARWKPPAPEVPTPAPEATPTPEPQPATRTGQAVPVSAPEVPAAAISAPEVSAAPTQSATVRPSPEDQQPTPQTADDRKPFFSVPYSVRSEVAPPPGSGSAEVQTVKQAVAVPVRPEEIPQPVAQQPVPEPSAPEPVSAPETETGDYPPSNELRFKAVNRSASEVKFAELAGDDQGMTRVVEPVSAPESQGEGAVSGVVAPPPGATVQTVTPSAKPVAEEAVPVQAGGTVEPPATVEQVVARPERVEVALPSGGGQVSGAVAPPPSVVQGAPPPAPEPDEVVEVPVTPSEPEQAAQTEAIPAPAEEPAVPDQPVSAEAQPGEEGQAAQPEKETPEQVRARIREDIYEAQSLMFGGNLQAALDIFEKTIKEPQIDDDAREEVLYAIADIKRQLYGDELAAHFEEVAQAYLEAMNANLRSNRVPRALLNLGLVNLKVGNFPEAKAYFKILQEKYPDDDNIPSISYYWGEYYYRMGDYKRAADQFQYLIQTYPEHELVKQAAFYLADSLNRTGFTEQAFQIVDYIDKRWPDYYMENMAFLTLAGDVETRLGMWEAAKNHYFTAFNLNPDADGADIVLARIGDLYLRLDQTRPAKEIYEKAVKEYPDREGGLVAKMRLAEEGIYDDPTMGQMVDVFDRPYNLRPENVYTEIVEKYPDSALAPVAQLKLAMWYAFNKKYSEALGAAQDFIGKFPDSPLVPRARKLGDSVFALAVPGLMEEERYGRVVRYWETYDFIGEKDTKVDNGTILSVATSYWKAGQPEKSLELIKPFLTEKQIPRYSDEALGLAVNIYLDQLAWQEIADLVQMAQQNWQLGEKQQGQLKYARAMSLQNLGDPTQALVLWADLAKNMRIDPAFRAYAMYYMAKSSMQRQDLRKGFVYAQEALSLLLQTNGDPEKIKDAVLMSIYATERSGRYGEALKWAREYDQYIDADNPEWASTRFKLARIYRKAGAIDEWKQLLQDIIDKKPQSLQAQLAKSALETYDLEQQTQQYAPKIQ
ncbi:tetratricopeptide repeat protein [Pseudodesulfovibrio tunisiensis]|uniref:tetratricopeptide repeat protein n=1 Tax=Pseudodesulfovibrio tunisiensis TaxID=463192 RepID=UPI001FB4C622|nr:tetratricopeptide repeat protein [Pseudodesulfovibrio tunisiensis]